MSYISELQVDNGAVVPIGSRLYGTCSTAASLSAKVVTLTDFDNLINGVTVHVKFTYGNTAALNSSFTLQVGSTQAKRVFNPGGRTNWSAGAVISFTYDSTDNGWIVNDSDAAAASSQITIDNTYNANSTNAISGQGVAEALNTLGEAANKDIIDAIIESGSGANKNSENLPTTAAITAYVDEKTADVEGSMHYRGTTTTTLFDGASTRAITINGRAYTAKPGDVVLSSTQRQEYIWVEINATTNEGYWELFGDEGAYALNTSTANVIDEITFNGGAPTEVTLKQNATSVLNGVSNNNNARVTSAVVENGTLKITTGILQTFSTTSIYEIDSINEGTAPTLSSHTKEVIVPYST